MKKQNKKNIQKNVIAEKKKIVKIILPVLLIIIILGGCILAYSIHQKNNKDELSEINNNSSKKNKEKLSEINNNSSKKNINVPQDSKKIKIRDSHIIDDCFIIDDEIMISTYFFTESEMVSEEERNIIDFILLDSNGEEKWRASFEKENKLDEYISLRKVIKQNDNYYLFVSHSKDEEDIDYLLTYNSKGELLKEELLKSNLTDISGIEYIGQIGEDYYFNSNYTNPYLLNNIIVFKDGNYKVNEVNKKEFGAPNNLSFEEIAENKNYPVVNESVIYDNYIYSFSEDLNEEKYYITKYDLKGILIESKEIKFNNNDFDISISSGSTQINLAVEYDDKLDLYEIDPQSLEAKLKETIKIDENNYFLYITEDKEHLNAYFDYEDGYNIFIYDRNMNKLSEYTTDDTIDTFGIINNKAITISSNKEGYILFTSSDLK